METSTAVSALSALAHETRLQVFRMLVRAGEGGLAAGEIARRLGSAPNTLSANLRVLSQAGLVHARREGRSIVYRADYGRMTGLIDHLVEDCCGGAPEICRSLGAAVLRASCRW